MPPSQRTGIPPEVDLRRLPQGVVAFAGRREHGSTCLYQVAERLNASRQLQRTALLIPESSVQARARVVALLAGVVDQAFKYLCTVAACDGAGAAAVAVEYGVG